MITSCQAVYIHMSFNLEHSSTTLELPGLSLKSEENGRHVNLGYC